MLLIYLTVKLLTMISDTFTMNSTIFRKTIDHELYL